MNYTENYKLRLPEPNDNYTVEDANENARITDTELHNLNEADKQKADKVKPAAAGNLASLDVEGNLQDSGKTAGDFAAAEHQHSADEITSGTLPVSRGGTGATSFTAGYALIGNGTSAVTGRAITNLTSTASALTANTNLITANTLRYMINRPGSVAAANTSYTTLMARGSSLHNAETSPSVNGAIAWTYE